VFGKSIQQGSTAANYLYSSLTKQQKNVHCSFVPRAVSRQAWQVTSHRKLLRTTKNEAEFIGYSDERSILVFTAFNNSCQCARRMSHMNLVYDLTHYEFRRKLRFFHVSSSRHGKYNNFVKNRIATHSTKSKENVRPSRRVFYVFSFSILRLQAVVTVLKLRETTKKMITKFTLAPLFCCI